jgi:hypothetical protein
MTEYVWKIDSLSVAPVGELVDVVRGVALTVSATDGPFTYACQHFAALPDPTSSDFKPLADLTEQEVLDWVDANVDQETRDRIYAVIDERIENYRQSTLTTVTPPWTA